MKRILVGLALAFVAFSSFAESAHPYIVGVRAQRDHHALLKEAVGLDGAALEARDFRDFDAIGQFAAELTDTEVAALRGRADVRFIERPLTVYAFAHDAAVNLLRTGPAAVSTQTIPWGIAGVHASDAWPVTRGIGVNVAIIDTGIDLNHPDVHYQYAGGYNAITQTDDTTDDDGHGTHVAGIIAAEDNFIGVIGAAPGARIWPIRALKHDPKSGTATGSTTDIADGINWLIRKKSEVGGNWVINMSLGICSDPTDTKCSPDPPQSLLTACQKASDAGILIFAASGNDSAPGAVKPVSYPAAFSTVVAVGAIDPTGGIATFSNQGPELAIVAPGQTIRSTYIVGKGTEASIDTTEKRYESIPMQYAATKTVSGTLVPCAKGLQASDFPAAVKGNIALIARGDVTFAVKTQNALSAGATAVVVYNNVPGPFVGGLGDATIAWPVVVSMSREDGEALAAKSGVQATIANGASDYEWMDGTSMASPHAAGVAALVWSAAPTAPASAIRQAMLSTAHDLGTPGQDPAFGFGLIDAVAATKAVAPQFFAAPEPANGRRTLKRGH